ncbi:flagellar biosynthesis anti-sigma factor FlgM [Endozoicomonas ascidiicola]|uniref:flagellar biosynthesis anti-sigma factor FlgM n=1 Tax=Endozoicomonas ascidiicola TaxID=1698521 RepID=UPI00082CB6E7|nr:flagellar biosynthesis anti-sigma factor FlgM [Endozoicomonas ascidiicola]
MSTSKIGGNDLSLLISEPRRFADKKDQASVGSTNAKPSSSLVEQATEKAMTTPDVDTAKVESIRRAISNGELKIDAEQLAQKMLEFEDAIFGAETE